MNCKLVIAGKSIYIYIILHIINRSRGLSVRFVVGIPGFDFFIKSDQKTKKVGIRIASRLRFSIKGVV